MSWLGNIPSILSQIPSIPGLTERVVDGTLSLIESEVSRFRNVEEELGRLRRTSDRIKSLLIDAEERRYIEDEAVKLWLSELRSICFDSDDLYDEYQTALNVHKHNSSLAETSRKRKRFEIPIPSFSLSPEWGPAQRRNFSVAIDKINKRLDEINNGRKHLRLRGEDGTRRPRPQAFQSTSYHDPERIVGRDIETDTIIDLLESDGDTMGKIPVVAVDGVAGIGKTALAKKVFEDARVGEYYKIWVCLPNGCDSMNAIKEIFKVMTNQSSDSGSPDMILNSIRDHLMQCAENKILLTIDNLWIEDFHFWETLRAVLLASKKEIKVLITTRNKQIGRLMSALPHSLTGLVEDECWELLRSLALPSGIDAHTVGRLEPIGREIVRKCGGSPMAAKILGALLNMKDEEVWNDVLSEMRALKDDKNGVLSSLKISYHHLPYHVKLCFSYCSIFPNGYKFEKEQLIRYWVAEGLIQPEGRRRLEGVGSMYFDDLLWRSFFEKAPSCDKSRVVKYKIPSLMYDLVRHVAQYEFVGLESSGQRDESGAQPSESDHMKARYCSLLHRDNHNNPEIEKVNAYFNLRTLKLCGEYNDIMVPLGNISPNLFRKLKCLRVLDLSNTLLSILPDSVGELIHLRYLGLSNTLIQNLPEKLGNLFNLQTLELKGCLKLKELPQGMSKLVNLRHLDLHIEWEGIKDSTELVIPQGIDKLESLQTLSRFNVPSENSEGQTTITELNQLNLRGDLCILNLENVKTCDDALNANLQGKQFIENLMLRWNKSATKNRNQWRHSMEVLKSLQPNNRIRRLWIMNYPGTRFPDWIGDLSFSSLETIRLSNCNNFKVLLLLAQLPRLKNLYIEKIGEKAMVLASGFQSLEYLTLLDLPFLEKLSLENELPKIQKVYVSECPDLQQLVIHRDVYPKFERGNCPRLSNSNIVYVPQD